MKLRIKSEHIFLAVHCVKLDHIHTHTHTHIKGPCSPHPSCEQLERVDRLDLERIVSLCTACLVKLTRDSFKKNFYTFSILFRTRHITDKLQWAATNAWSPHFFLTPHSSLWRRKRLYTTFYICSSTPHPLETDFDVENWCHQWVWEKA